MTITSLEFILFIFGVIILYYVMPRKFQWCILLMASLVFYLLCSITGFIYIMITTVSVYVLSIAISRLTSVRRRYLKCNKEMLSKNEKKNYKKRNKRNRRLLLIVALIINFGFLILFKYSHFLVEQMNSLLNLIGLQSIDNSFNLIVPLGISYYTLQSSGYVIDIYREKYEAEKNPFKVLLFVTFFPQITQGPISEYSFLSKELFSYHNLSYENYAHGFQRMLWGFFKKMAIADVLSPYVTSVLQKYSELSGLTLLVGAVLYMLQMYADFSGYMDIMCGYCQMLGIKLTENFKRPFFSKSVSEFWRRWHISLGAWLRNYVYYPVALSKWNQGISERSRKRIGTYVSDLLPTTIALFFVWLFIGLWHDASWTYIAWGLGNAFFIILSTWLEPVYIKMKNKLKIQEKSLGYKMFQVVRTFAIIVFLEVVAAVDVMGGSGMEYCYKIFTNHPLPKSINFLLPNVGGATNVSVMSLVIAIIGLIVMFCISVWERNHSFIKSFNGIPTAIRIIILACLSLIVLIFGVQATWESGAFMYANF